MAFKPTKEQKDAISARGTTLVSAAAGSGKTAVLTTRVVSAMINSEKPIPADRLLVVTFTNAAAAEMRSRISDRLSAALEADPANLLIRRQLLLMQNASILTIDSFCIDLVRENFSRLGVSPDFKIASAESVAAMSDRIISSILEEEFSTKNPDFLALIEALGSDFGADRLASAILKIYEYSSSMPFPKKWRDECAADYFDFDKLSGTKWGKVIFDSAAREINSAARMLRAAVEDYGGDAVFDSAYKAVLESGAEQIEAMLPSAVSHNWDELRLRASSFGFPRAGSVKTLDDPFVEDMKETVSLIRKRADSSVKKISSMLVFEEEQEERLIKRLCPVIGKLIELVNRYESDLFAELCSRNMLTFADAEHLALSLFVKEENGEIVEVPGADEIRERFDEILVDEYQDTNKLQDTLFSALSGERNNLFMVGDVKQSIYRFRHADPSGFLNKKNSFSSDISASAVPKKIILGKNFRSRRGICEFVNFCFTNLMSCEAGEMEYSGEERLVPAADFPAIDQPETEMVLLEYPKDETDRVEAEAAYIADWIKAKVDGGMPVRDPENPGELRPCRYSDFAVLLRSFSGKAEIYAEELYAAGIPVSANTGSLLSSAEVMTFLSLLKVISNPTHDIPLTAVMSSPIFGFSYDELALIKADCQQKDAGFYQAVLGSAESGNKKSADFLEKIREYRRMKSGRNVDKFLLDLLEETGYLDIVSAMRGGERRKANLLLLVDIAADYSKEGSLSLSEFTARFELAGKNGNLKTAPPPGDSENAVRIMSIHSSKGLQFPVCILANCSGKMNKTDTTQSLLVSEELGIGLKFQDDSVRRRFSTAARAAISASVSRATSAEELRLLYVAMTRAEERLLIVLCEENFRNKILSAASSASVENGISPAAVLSAASYADWLLMCAALHPSGRDIFGRRETLPTEQDNFFNIHYAAWEPAMREGESKQPDQSFEPALLDQIRERFEFVYPYAALNRIAAKTGVSRIAEQESGDDYSFSAVPSFLSGTGLTAAQKGTAIHKFMQLVDFDDAEVSTENEAARLVESGFLSAEEGQAVAETSVGKFFESEVYSRMKASPKVMREVRFIDEVPASLFDETLPDEVKNEPVIIQGVADCIFEEEDGLVILDYKTDRISDMSQLAERYAAQLRIYAVSAEKTFGKPVRGCIIYSFHNGQEIKI